MRIALLWWLLLWGAVEMGVAEVILSTSHTHTGPVVGTNLRPMYFHDELGGPLLIRVGGG